MAMRATPRRLIDGVIAGQFRGAARLRKLLRRSAPNTLIEFEAAHGMRLVLNPESYIDSIVV